MNDRSPEFANVVVIAMTAFILAGCSSMSAKECSVVDWRSVGYEDGVKGLAGDHIRTYREACAKYGVTSDLASYQAGRDAGLLEFCQPANGYRTGVDGYEYRGVCPASMEGAFSAAYHEGHELHVLEWRADNAAEQLNAARRQREVLQQQMLSSGTAVLLGDLAFEARAHALLDTKQMADEAARLDEQIAQLEFDKQRADQELANYRARVAANR